MNIHPVILAMSFCSLSEVACPKDWVYIQGSCYKFSSKSLKWNAAKAACEVLGSTLVVVNSQAEQQALNPKVLQFSWIGLYRDPKDLLGWLWVDWSRPTYTHWAKYEPNTPNEERCAVMRTGVTYSGRWNDISCDHSRHYICDKQ